MIEATSPPKSEERRFIPDAESERVSSVPPPIPRPLGPSMSGAMALAVLAGLVLMAAGDYLRSLFD